MVSCAGLYTRGWVRCEFAIQAVRPDVLQARTAAAGPDYYEYVCSTTTDEMVAYRI